MTARLADRVCIVAGAGSEIGRPTAELFATDMLFNNSGIAGVGDVEETLLEFGA